MTRLTGRFVDSIGVIFVEFNKISCLDEVATPPPPNLIDLDLVIRVNSSSLSFWTFDRLGLSCLTTTGVGVAKSTVSIGVALFSIF